MEAEDKTNELALINQTEAIFSDSLHIINAIAATNNQQIHITDSDGLICSFVIIPYIFYLSNKTSIKLIY